jgi:hypothetical protein
LGRVTTVLIANKKPSLRLIRTAELLPTAQTTIVLVAIAEIVPIATIPALALALAGSPAIIQAAPISGLFGLFHTQAVRISIVVISHPSTFAIVAQLDSVLMTLHFAILIRV